MIKLVLFYNKWGFVLFFNSNINMVCCRDQSVPSVNIMGNYRETWVLVFFMLVWFQICIPIRRMICQCSRYRPLLSLVPSWVGPQHLVCSVPSTSRLHPSWSAVLSHSRLFTWPFEISVPASLFRSCSSLRTALFSFHYRLFTVCWW